MSAVVPRRSSHQSRSTDLEASRARARSLALDADPKAAEMRRFLRSHTHEQRLRSAAGLCGSSEAAAAGAPAGKQSSFSFSAAVAAAGTHSSPSISDHVNLLRRPEDDARGAGQPSPPGGCRARLAWRGELDRQVSRLLQDGEELLDPRAPLREADRHRLRCGHLDKAYDWFSKHGRKEVAKERPGPHFLRFDPDEPPQPGSLRRALADRPLVAAPGWAPPADVVRRSFPTAPPMVPFQPPLPASPPATAWLARVPQSALARRRAPSALPPLEGFATPPLPPAEAPAEPAPLAPAAQPQKAELPAAAPAVLELVEHAPLAPAAQPQKAELPAAAPAVLELAEHAPPAPVAQPQKAVLPAAAPAVLELAEHAPPAPAAQPQRAELPAAAPAVLASAEPAPPAPAAQPQRAELPAAAPAVLAPTAEPPKPAAAAPVPRVAVELANRPTPLRRRGAMRRHASTPAVGLSAASPSRVEEPTSLRVDALHSLVAASAARQVPSEALAEQEPSSSRRSGRGLESLQATAAAPPSARRAKSVGALDWKVLRDRSAIIRASAHAGC